jgi:hypothetical protein
VDDSVAFARLLEALDPWLGDLLIVGGRAHRLYRFHPLAQSPNHAPVVTRDADVAFDLNARLVGNIGAALKGAGFDEELSGEYIPPVTEYRLGEEDQGFFAEFLTPLRGGEFKRDGTPDATVKKAGVIAQKLRHVDLLLIAPWSVKVSTDVGVPVGKPLRVKVPNPVSYIAQKLLIQKHRKPDKRPQDVLYIHDTLELFARELTALRKIWREQVRPQMPEKTARTVEKLRRQQFDAVSDVHRSAVRIQQDRGLTPAGLQEASSYGLGAVFGD